MAPGIGPKHVIDRLHDDLRVRRWTDADMQRMAYKPVGPRKPGQAIPNAHHYSLLSAALLPLGVERSAHAQGPVWAGASSRFVQSTIDSLMYPPSQTGRRIETLVEGPSFSVDGAPHIEASSHCQNAATASGNSQHLRQRNSGRFGDPSRDTAGECARKVMSSGRGGA